MLLGNDGTSFAAPEIVKDREDAIGSPTGIRAIGRQVGIVRVPGNSRRQRQHAGWRR